MISALVLSLMVKSAAFSAGEAIPRQYSCQGKDVPPPLTLSEPPAGTQSWALLVDDPDAPGRTFVHWTVWNLPVAERTIGEKPLPKSARQGKNDFGKIGYGGPCPPPGKVHHYRFRAFALDGELTLPPGASSAELERAMKGHILGETTLVGTFAR